MTSDREERIRRRAYEIWENEGRPHGHAMEHWEQAAREIAAEKGESIDSDAEIPEMPADFPEAGEASGAAEASASATKARKRGAAAAQKGSETENAGAKRKATGTAKRSKKEK